MNRVSLSIVTLLGLLFCLAGCGHHSGDHDEHASDHDSHAAAPDSHAADDESHASGPQLELNDGKKWQVDEHTRTSAENITRLVNETELIRSTADAQALAEGLDQELESLVQGCTMTGPSHDQLHVFLVALLPKVNELKTKTDVDDLRITRAGISTLLDAYERHFE